MEIQDAKLIVVKRNRSRFNEDTCGIDFGSYSELVCWLFKDNLVFIRKSDLKQVRAVGGNIELFFIEVNAILIIRVWVVDENNVSGKKVNELNFEEIES